MITLRLDKNGGINKGDIKAFEHDNLSEVYIIQLYKNGEVYSLTNKTVELIMLERKRKLGDIFDLPIYEATEGKVKLGIVTELTKQDGLYDFQITVKDTTGLIETFPHFQIDIKRDLVDDIAGGIIEDPNFTILSEGLKSLSEYNVYKENALKVGTIEQDLKNYKTENEGKIEEFASQLDNIVRLEKSTTVDTDIQEKINNVGCVNILGKQGEHEINNSILLKSNTELNVANNVTIKNSENNPRNIIKKDTTIDRLENITVNGGIYDYNLRSAGGNENHAIFIHKGNNISLTDMTILNARKYAFLLADINGATIRDIKLNTSSDGIHFQPPLKDIYVNNIKGTTHDDMLAITIGDYANYNTSSGDVEDFYASNIYPNGTMTVLKLCGQSGYKFKRIVIENVVGSTFHEGFYFRTDGDILNDFTADFIKLSNIKVKTGGDDYPLLKLWTSTQMNIDTLILENVEHDGRLFDITGTRTWSINIKNLHFKNIKNIISNEISTLKYNGFIGTNVTIENLYLDDIKLNSDDILSTVYECFIETRGTIKNLYINGCKIKFPVNKYALIRNINGAINNLNLDCYYQYQGACVYYQNAKTYNAVIRINNTNLDEVWEAFNVNANTTFTLSSTTTSRNGATFRTNNASGTYKITGKLINTANVNVSCVASASVGNIYVDGNLNVDIEKVKGLSTGARCYSTNGNVWTGRGYYSYANWGWEKEVNKNVVRYVTSDYTIDKYDSFIKANGSITITLPDSSPIMGKSYTIFNISTTATVTINNSSGVNVGTISPNTRKDIISGGSSWHIF